MPIWPITAAQVRDVVGGELHGEPGATAARVLVDTRSGVGPGDLFVGLVGPNFDGGAFVPAALEDGASVAITATAPDGVPEGRAVVVVPDALGALQALAAEARRRFGGQVLAITGSNGKTVTKDMVAAAVGAAVRASVSPMSYNSQVGVALSLLDLDPQADLAIVECGISRVGEMGRLRAMVQPDYGIVTNIGDAHLEGLGDRTTTAREKACLFSGTADHPVAWVLVPDDEALAIAALQALGVTLRRLVGEGAEGTVVWQGQPIALPLEHREEVFLRDAALAAVAARLLGVSAETIEAGLSGWRPAPMRLERSVTPRGVVVINDAYTADPESTAGALRALVQERGRGRTVAVLGGMAQLGLGRSRAHERIGRLVASLGVDVLIGIGSGGGEIVSAAVQAGMPRSRVRGVDDVQAASGELEAVVSPGDRVLLKGSRPERLERLAAMLGDGLAPARLHIDLDQLVDNYHRLQRFVGADCGVMAVVKAFGYGLDATRVARALQDAGVVHLCVAYPDEGIALRDVGVTRPILVQNVVPAELSKVVAHALSAQVATVEDVQRCAAEARRQRRRLRVHLKVDTGMGRHGATGDEVARVAEAIRAASWLRFDGLMTHFSAAEDPEQDGWTARQVAGFDDAMAAVAASGPLPPFVHACNSAGAMRFPAAHHTMVRSGLGLLGYAGSESASLGQRPVLRLETRVIAVRDLPPHVPVGYGLAGNTGPDGARIAVVALGYGDGYPLALSGRGWMAVRGRRCPVVGRVCMDVTMIDVSECAEPPQPGEVVVVYGDRAGEPELVEAAQLASTIPYELLTRLSHRVRRIYHSSR